MEVQLGVGLEEKAQLESWLPMGVQPGFGLECEAQLESWL
jgi:hypothetical protein